MASDKVEKEIAKAISVFASRFSTTSLLAPPLPITDHL